MFKAPGPLFRPNSATFQESIAKIVFGFDFAAECIRHGRAYTFAVLPLRLMLLLAIWPELRPRADAIGPVFPRPCDFAIGQPVCLPIRLHAVAPRCLILLCTVFIEPR